MGTVHLGLSTLSENQAGAEVTFNESMYILDAITQASAIDRIFAAPTSGLTTGDVYLIHGGTPGGGDAWFGYENYIAFYFTDTWKFIAPKEGMMIYIVDEDRWRYYTGAAWNVAPLKTDSIAGHLVLPEEVNYTVDLRAAQAYNITELSGLTSAGSCTIQLTRTVSGGSPGLIGSSVSVDSTGPDITTTSFPVAVAENDKIELTVSSVSSAANLAFGVKIEL